MGIVVISMKLFSIVNSRSTFTYKYPVNSPEKKPNRVQACKFRCASDYTSTHWLLSSSSGSLYKSCNGLQYSDAIASCTCSFINVDCEWTFCYYSTYSKLFANLMSYLTRNHLSINWVQIHQTK